ncbi:MAG: PQQ-binding-like beta-propeller repeat protein, partial [bacterium]
GPAVCANLKAVGRGGYWLPDIYKYGKADLLAKEVYTNICALPVLPYIVFPTMFVVLACIDAALWGILFVTYSTNPILKYVTFGLPDRILIYLLTLLLGALASISYGEYRAKKAGDRKCFWMDSGIAVFWTAIITTFVFPLRNLMAGPLFNFFYYGGPMMHLVKTILIPQAISFLILPGAARLTQIMLESNRLQRIAARYFVILIIAPLLVVSVLALPLNSVNIELESASAKEVSQRVAWQVKLLPIVGKPLLADDTIYVATWDRYNERTVNTVSRYLTARDAESGEEKWRFIFKEFPGEESAPFISEGILCFVSGGYLYALDAQTGEEKWHAYAAGNFGVGPEIRDGVLYYKEARGKWYFLDPKTGQPVQGYEAWQVMDTDLVVNFFIHEGMAYYTGFNDNAPGEPFSESVYVVDLNSGKTLWQFTGERYNYANLLPMVNGAIGVLGGKYDEAAEVNRYSIGALDAGTGKLLWEKETGEYYPEPLVIDSGVMLIGEMVLPYPEIETIALDLKTGKELWRRDRSIANYTKRDDIFIAAEYDSKSNELSMVSAEPLTGELYWSRVLDDAGTCKIEFGEGVVFLVYGPYFTGEKHQVSITGFDWQTGETVWDFTNDILLQYYGHGRYNIIPTDYLVYYADSGENGGTIMAIRREPDARNPE